MSVAEKRKKLEEQVEKSRKDFKADRMDMSFGEIMNMYDEKEIVISSDFQRAFRWKKDQQSKFIESLILGIPIPPIFVAERKDNVWELVDGLQRLSTILSFFGKLQDEEKNNLVLRGASILTELDGFTIDTLPIYFKLLLKRAVCRVEILRYDSEYNMRYELFNRLNTGGVVLSKQELRNCIFRIYDNKFSNFICEMSEKEYFTSIIKISKEQKERMYAQELVLRFFTIKNFKTTFDRNIQYLMDEYMLQVSKKEIAFQYKEEENIFEQTCEIIQNLKENVFKMSPHNFSIVMYDALMINIAFNMAICGQYSAVEFKEKIEKLKKDNEFRKKVNSIGSSRMINRKLEIAHKVLIN